MTTDSLNKPYSSVATVGSLSKNAVYESEHTN